MKIQKLIKSNHYSIRINILLIQKIDDYCKSNNLTDETKSKIQILTGFVYDRQQKLDTEKVCVPQQVLRKLFSNKRYQEILTHCENSTIKLTRQANKFVHKAKHFKINDELFDNNTIIFYPNITKRYERVLERFERAKYDNAEQMDIFFKDSRVKLQNMFLENIKSKFSPEKVEFLSEKLKMEFADKKKSIEKYQTMFLGKNPYLFKVINVDQNGRIYNIFTYCKKEFRELVKDDFVEVDISNSHPFILGSIFKNLCEDNPMKNLENKLIENEKMFFNSEQKNKSMNNINIFNYIKQSIKLTNLKYYLEVYNNNILDNDYNFNCVHFKKNRVVRGINFDEIKSEIYRFERFATSGDFYNIAIKTINNYHKDVRFKPILIQKEVCQFLKIEKSVAEKCLEKDIPYEWKKGIIKLSFMYWMNGTVDNGRYKIKKLYQLIYPNITAMLNFIKKHSKSKNCIHSLVTTIESDLIYSTIKQGFDSEKSFVAGSVHDAIFVEKSNKERLISILQNTSKELLNNIPNIKTK